MIRFLLLPLPAASPLPSSRSLPSAAAQPRALAGNRCHLWLCCYVSCKSRREPSPSSPSPPPPPLSLSLPIFPLLVFPPLLPSLSFSAPFEGAGRDERNENKSRCFPAEFSPRPLRLPSSTLAVCDPLCRALQWAGISRGDDSLVWSREDRWYIVSVVGAHV